MAVGLAARLGLAAPAAAAPAPDAWGIVGPPRHAHAPGARTSTSFTFNPLASIGPAGTAGLGAAAGAGVGGQIMFRMCTQKCHLPSPACEGVKDCVISCGNKSHMAGAAAAGAGSLLGNFAGEKAQGGDMGLDEYTAGPIFAQWRHLEDEERSLRSCRASRGAARFPGFWEFLGGGGEGARVEGAAFLS